MDWKRRRTLPSSVVRRVAIVGGTHGNESNGVWLAKHYLRNPDLVKRPSFETVVLLSNTRAIQQNTRYVDEDLNRCFYQTDLSDPAKADTTWERKRAREVDAFLGPKGSLNPRCDFVIDLHNTTAATGVALMMAADDAFSHELGYHLMGLDSSVKICHWGGTDDWALCPSVGRSGMTFEVGPCPWGCLIGDLWAQSNKLVLAMLDYIEEHNALVTKGASLRREITVPVFRGIGVHMDYPRDKDGGLAAMVHPDRQGQDFKELKDGDNLFLMFNGDVITFNRSAHKVPEGQPVYLLFVNEAAYYEKKIALMLVRSTEAKFTVLSHVG